VKYQAQLPSTELLSSRVWKAQPIASWELDVDAIPATRELAMALWWIAGLRNVNR
jgi:hypothetical protein